MGLLGDVKSALGVIEILIQTREEARDSLLRMIEREENRGLLHPYKAIITK